MSHLSDLGNEILVNVNEEFTLLPGKVSVSVQSKRAPEAEVLQSLTLGIVSASRGSPSRVV